MRLEEIGLEADRPFVQRLRLDQLVAAVVDVGEVDERGDQYGIVLERLAVRAAAWSSVASSPSSSADAGAEVLLGQRGIAARDRRARAGGGGAAARCSVRIFAGAASSRKSNAS